MRLAFTNFSIKSPTGRKSGRFFLALFLGIFLFLTHPMLCQAGFASSTPFTGASWELVGEYPILGSNGAVQSVCATEDYIICIENFNDLTTEPDVVSAYYKNDTDASLPSRRSGLPLCPRLIKTVLGLITNGINTRLKAP